MKNSVLFNTLKSHLPNALPEYGLLDFIDTEMVLSVLEMIRPNGNAAKAYLLLCNYMVIPKKGDHKRIAYLQKAHQRLGKYASKHNWKRALSCYRNTIFDGIRQYCVHESKTDDNKTILNVTRNMESIPAPNRDDIYRQEILHYQVKPHYPKYAKTGSYSYKIDSDINPQAEVELSCENLAPTRSPSPKGQRPDITITLDEFCEAAKEFRKFIPDDHSLDVFSEKNLPDILKEVTGFTVKACNHITLKNVTNIVGIVGSGKTTMIKLLSYVLAKRNQKVVLVVDTITEVMRLYSFFKNCEVSVSPLISGRYERFKYIEQMMQPDKMYLDKSISRYLTTACIIDGLKPIGTESVRFGKEPCNKLYRSGARHVCPYFDICPSTLMHRQAISSNIVVTTVAGLAATRIGANRRLFADYVLEQADLVVFDECDRAQKALDEFFTPATEFIKFIHETADECHADLKKSNEKRLQNRNDSYYAELLKKAATMLDIIQDAIRSEKGKWGSLLSGTFSSMTLLERLKKDGISERIITSLSKLIESPQESDLFVTFELSCNSFDDRAFAQSFERWLDILGLSLSQIEKEHVKLCIMIARFDEYIQELETAYFYTTNADDPNNELYNFLQARFILQQRILPSSVLGNRFGMKCDPKKGLILYRQYAFGRALMTELPWLRMSEDGSALGPHVLLLSGSSWAKGCLEYHVNCPVNYLLETDVWKRIKLSETKIIDLGIPDRVSGAEQQERKTRLVAVIKKSMNSILAELNCKEKILMIVNSYEEAEFAQQKLQACLAEAKQDAIVAAMVKSGGVRSSKSIPRGDVHRFHNHPARILICPAACIERGHNIVDKKGHSSFGSVFFLVRPMPVPNQIHNRCSKLNGMVSMKYADLMDDDKYENEYEKVQAIRAYAAKQWGIMERNSSLKGLSYLPSIFQEDVTASVFVLILQIFGRLARLTDPTKPAIRLYFADGAYRAHSKDTGGYDCLNSLREYLDKMMMDYQYSEVAKTLYLPFYEAFKKGVQHNESDISNDVSSEYKYED